LKSGLVSGKWPFERIIANFPMKPHFHEMAFGKPPNNVIPSICCAYHRVTSLYDMTFGHFRV
jgi:hypothetical protein